jgi:ribosomal protein S18 acetylase RimI-like enzyme
MLCPLPLPYALRHASSQDQAFIDALYFACRDDLHSAVPDPVMLRQLIAMQQRMQQAGFAQRFPQAQQCIVLKGQEALGRVVFDCTADRIHVVDIAIAPTARRQGAATAVLQGLQAHAAAHALALTLSVALSNQRAGRLYRQLGFAMTGQDAVFEHMAWSALA